MFLTKPYIILPQPLELGNSSDYLPEKNNLNMESYNGKYNELVEQHHV